MVTIQALVQQGGKPMARVLHRLPPQQGHTLLRLWRVELQRFHRDVLANVNPELARILRKEWEDWFLNEFEVMETGHECF